MQSLSLKYSQFRMLPEVVWEGRKKRRRRVPLSMTTALSRSRAELIRSGATHQPQSTRARTARRCLNSASPHHARAQIPSAVCRFSFFREHVSPWPIRSHSLSPRFGGQNTCTICKGEELASKEMLRGGGAESSHVRQADLVERASLPGLSSRPRRGAPRRSERSEYTPDKGSIRAAAGLVLNRLSSCVVRFVRTTRRAKGRTTNNSPRGCRASRPASRARGS